MAIRNTIHVLKNSDIVNRPLPSSLKAGEPIINTADGILYFSGVTTSTNEWTPAGTGTTANFFEVGSNLYDLQLRNRLTKYENISGAGLVGKFLSGTTNGFVLGDISAISGVDSYVTGGTYNPTTDAITLTLSEGKPNVVITGIGDNYTTGSTLIGTTAYFDRNDTLSAYTLDLSTFVASGDTYATGYTYTPSTNTFTITGNNSFTPLSAIINSVSGLTVSNLTAGRVVYVGSGGSLTDELGFEYNDSTNTLLAGNINTSAAGSGFIGTGGLIVGSGGSLSGTGVGDLTVHGNFTVFGDAISAFTGNLYVEDNNVFLNYNPSGSTAGSSVGAGFTIQDGNGVASGDVNFDIRAMNGFTGLTATEIPDITEYSGPTGYANRAWATQLNDIVIRSTNIATPNGVRVLAEFDVLDGGSY